MQTTAIAPRRSVNEIAFTVAAMLERHLIDPRKPSFVAIPLPERVVVSVNPLNVRNIDFLLSDRFIHGLKTSLGGCQVLKSNTYGIFYQIAYEPVSKRHRLDSRLLHLEEQPGPLHVPVGSTAGGSLWISIREADSVLIGGTRGFGKTVLIHSWIQALIRGGAVDLWLYDGKEGNHFSRYGSQPGVTIAEPLDDSLIRLESELARRRAIFSSHGVYNLDGYNALGFADPIKPIILIVDEVKDISPEATDRLAHLIRKERERGLHIVCATQRTGVDDVPANIKANLTTRICFAVPEQQDSRVVLGRNGAEKLPKIPGRLLIVWHASLIEAQAYNVQISDPAAHSVGNLPIGSDWQLALRVHAESGGAVSIPMLKSFGMSSYRAEQLLRRWQEAGWTDGVGQGTARRLSPRVLRAISESLKVPESSESTSFWPESTSFWPESAPESLKVESESVSTETAGENHEQTRSQVDC